MKRFFTITIILALLAIWATPAGAITGGEPDATHTNVGALLIYDPIEGPLGWCSGILIHERVFLSAGHCVEILYQYFPIESMRVTFGDDVFDGAEYQQVQSIHIHPGYIDHPDRLIPPHRSDNHDVAAVILAEPVTITPAALPSVGFLDELNAAGLLRQGSTGAMFTVVGYGATLDFPPPVQNLDGLRRSAQSEFLSLLDARLHTSTNPATGSGGTCFMDSGGPAFWTNPDGSDVVVGVLSWAKNCVASQYHYRLDAADVRSFIEGVIAGIGE